MAERVEVTFLCRWCGASVRPWVREIKTGKPLKWEHDGGYQICYEDGEARQAEPTWWKKVGGGGD